MRVPVDADSGVSPELLAKRRGQIEAILKKLGLENKLDLMVWLTGDIKHGEHKSVIRLNPTLSDGVFLEVFAHELLHYLGLPHNESARQIKFSSTDGERDLITQALARLITE